MNIGRDLYWRSVRSFNIASGPRTTESAVISFPSLFRVYSIYIEFRCLTIDFIYLSLIYSFMN